MVDYPPLMGRCLKTKKAVKLDSYEIVAMGAKFNRYAAKGKSKDCPHEVWVIMGKDKAEELAKKIGKPIGKHISKAKPAKKSKKAKASNKPANNKKNNKKNNA